MGTHSSVLAWRIPGVGEPGGLLSMGSHRVGHDWSDLAVAAAGDCEGQGSLACCSPWGNDWDTTERLNSNNTHTNIYIHTHVYISSFQVIRKYWSIVTYAVQQVPVGYLFYMCVYKWITVLWSPETNIVNQIHFNQTKTKNKYHLLYKLQGTPKLLLRF